MKAMILAAGYGTRLGNLTKDIPKPMLDIGGRPLLEYIVTNLSKCGFKEMAINLHYKPEIIHNHFKDGDRFGIKITYSYENELLGTAGAVKNIAHFFKGEDYFLVHYGDVLTNENFIEFLSFHLEKKAFASLLIHQRNESNSIVCIDASKRITGFLERPTNQEREKINSKWVNSGVYICSTEILSEIPENVKYDFPKDVFSKIIDSHKLFGFPLTGYRCAIDSEMRLNEARLAMQRGCF